MKKLFCVAAVLMSINTLANDFVGIWKPASMTGGATEIVAYDADGTLDISSGDYPGYCDQFSVTGNKNILKDKTKNVDDLLICMADGDPDIGVFAISYSDDKKEALVKDIADNGPYSAPRFISKNDAVNLDQLRKVVGLENFTITADGEGELNCTKLGAKTVNNAIVVSEMIYACDATPDPDTNIILMLDNTDKLENLVGRYYFTQDSKRDKSDKLVKMN